MKGLHGLLIVRAFAEEFHLEFAGVSVPPEHVGVICWLEGGISFCIICWLHTSRTLGLGGKTGCEWYQPTSSSPAALIASMHAN